MYLKEIDVANTPAMIASGDSALILNLSLATSPASIDIRTRVFFAANLIYTLGGTGGLITSLLIILASIRSRTLRRHPHCFVIICVAISDAIFSFGFFFSGITRIVVFSGAHNLTQMTCCALNLPMSFGSAYQQLITLVVALERVYAVAFWDQYQPNQPDKDHQKFAVRGVIAATVFALVIVALMFPFSDPRDPVNGLCNTAAGTHRSYSTFFLVSAQILPTYLTYAIYACLPLIVRCVQRWDKVGDSQSTQLRHLPRRNPVQEGLTKTVSLLILSNAATIGIASTLDLLGQVIAKDDGRTQSLIAHIAGCIAVWSPMVNFAVLMGRPEVAKGVKTQCGWCHRDSQPSICFAACWMDSCKKVDELPKRSIQICVIELSEENELELSTATATNFTTL